MRAGQLRKRVVIERPADPPTQDAFGAVVETWVEHGTRSAAVEPLQGNEFFAAQQTQAAVDYRIRFRYDSVTSSITAGMRIRQGARIFDVQHPAINPDTRRAEIHVAARVRT